MYHPVELPLPAPLLNILEQVLYEDKCVPSDEFLIELGDAYNVHEKIIRLWFTAQLALYQDYRRRRQRHFYCSTRTREVRNFEPITKVTLKSYKKPYKKQCEKQKTSLESRKQTPSQPSESPVGKKLIQIKCEEPNKKLSVSDSTQIKETIFGRGHRVKFPNVRLLEIKT